MQLSKRKLVSFALAAAVVFGILPLGGCGGDSNGGKSKTFDENDVVLSFSAMSDIHQQKGKTAYSEMLINAFDYAKELNGGDLDLALLAGDLTEETWRQTKETRAENADYSLEYNADIEMLKTTLETALDLDKTPVFYCLGNHDTDPSVLGTEIMSRTTELFYNQLGEKFFTADAADSVPEAGLRHAVVNGYHFLSVQPDYYWTLRGYSDETLSWLDSQLKKITSESPEQYVFVTAHPPVYATVFGSYANDWADLDVSEVLEKYPQVIYFSGHIHNVLQDEIQISQNGSFTALDCGSVKYTAVMNDINDARTTSFDNSVGTRIDDFSQGLLVQVDGSGNVRVTRCNYYSRSPIKDAWELTYPQKDNSHLLAYDNDARQRANEAPAFSADATLEVTKSGDSLFFNWPAATDDDMVRYYRISVYRTENGAKTKLATYNLATFTYLYDRVEDMPKELSYNRVVTYSGECLFECSAVDIWGAISEPITATFTV